MTKIILSSLIFSSFIILAACSMSPKRDYAASAACTNQGYKAGTAEFENCVKIEHSAALLKQQEQQADQQRQYDQYQRAYRATTQR